MLLGVVMSVLGAVWCVCLMMCLGCGVALRLGAICVGASCMFVCLCVCVFVCFWCCVVLCCVVLCCVVLCLVCYVCGFG